MDAWTIIGAAVAGTGFWNFIIWLIQHWHGRVSTEGQMLRGLAHDRICYLGQEYIRHGFISREDYENLHDYLYIPYVKLGGNGTVTRIMEEVKKLPIR